MRMDSKANTISAVRFLVQLYLVTGDERYREAALKAGEWSYQNVYLNMEYRGSTCDNTDIIDNESGIYAMFGFMSLYDLTGEQKWLEALIGAIYMDGGFANAKEFIHRFILNDLENKTLFFYFKTILQDIVQANSKSPITYQLVGEEGPDHDKSFRVSAYIGEEEYGVGIGRTKKGAEQVAAYQSILKLRSKNIK